MELSLTTQQAASKPRFMTLTPVYDPQYPDRLSVAVGFDSLVVALRPRGWRRLLSVFYRSVVVGVREGRVEVALQGKATWKTLPRDTEREAAAGGTATFSLSVPPIVLGSELPRPSRTRRIFCVPRGTTAMWNFRAEPDGEYWEGHESVPLDMNDPDRAPAAAAVVTAFASKFSMLCSDKTTSTSPFWSMVEAAVCAQLSPIDEPQDTLRGQLS
jgi:hypothetical protein